VILEDATTEDLKEATEWALAKAVFADVPVEDLEGASFLKVKDVFYVPVKMVPWEDGQALFIGPLLIRPDVEGKRLGLALHRMIQGIRKSYSGDIIYRNVEENGIDTLARYGGFEGTAGGMMVQRGSHVQRPQ